MSRRTRIKIWLKVILSEIISKPITYLAGLLIGLSLLLSAVTANQSLTLSRRVESEALQRREDACAYAQYQADREKQALIRTVTRLITSDNLPLIVEVINEEYDKLPPSTACLDQIPDVTGSTEVPQ